MSVAWRFRPLTPETWADLEALFGPRGASGGCWCMWWRVEKKAFEAGRGETNRRALERLAGGERPPGVLAYDGDRAVGWCAVGPREDYPRMDRSRVLARLDDRPVWTVSCFFVAPSHRGGGLSVALLEEAARFARDRGALTVEGHPVDPTGDLPGVFAWTGLASAFRRAGFAEVARRSPTRPVMRRELEPAPARGRCDDTAAEAP